MPKSSLYAGVSRQYVISRIYGIDILVGHAMIAVDKRERTMNELEQTKSIASAALNLYLTITDDIGDEGVEDLAQLVATFIDDFGAPGRSIDSDDLLNALQDAVAEYYDE